MQTKKDMVLNLSPPEAVRGMKCLQRDAFKRTLSVPAFRVDAKHCSLLLSQLNKYLLNQPRLRNIVPDTNGDAKKKIVLLNPEVQFNTDQENLVQSCSCESIMYVLTLDYDFWSCEQILRAVLPKDIVEITTAFETVGHIAHMNLREKHLSYKELIGQVILDKNVHIKSVVNKVNTIDETYRFFHMELLAGENQMVTTVKEHGCIFSFDFSKVYWNSRLQSEHKRLVETFVKTDIICDMFAGVGPFAIPAAKKGCIVYANDLNPESFSALKSNCKLNNVEKNIHCFNMDARSFVIDLMKNKVLNLSQVIMNLPASAVEFLDVFKGLYFSSEPSSKLPTVHCYCFSKAENPVLDAQSQVESALGISSFTCNVVSVRKVAPNKTMLCVSFVLPHEVACHQFLQSNTRKRDEGEEAGTVGDESSKCARLT